MKADAAKDTAVSAPGKLFLIGEYAVLTGTRRRRRRRSPGDRPLRSRGGAGDAAGRARSIEAVARVPGRGRCLASRRRTRARQPRTLVERRQARPRLQRRGRRGRRRGAAGSVRLRHRVQQGARVQRSHRAHRAAQGGRGSGADVAAAVHGGVIAYARRDADVDRRSRSTCRPASVMRVLDRHAELDRRPSARARDHAARSRRTTPAASRARRIADAFVMPRAPTGTRAPIVDAAALREPALAAAGPIAIATCRSSPRASPRRRRSPRSWAARPSRRGRAAATSASRS